MKVVDSYKNIKKVPKEEHDEQICIWCGRRRNHN